MSGRPLVSVLVVTHGRWDLAERALDAVREHTEVPHEVIVVDNASRDGTRAGLEGREGVRAVFNDTNVGFGPAANQAASLARGSLLCLLNSDAFVERGWLPPLLAALEDPEVAAAVPQVLNMDGSLQEAGSLVSGDGHTLALGRDGDPEDPAFLFPRSVDYGSALCLLVRKEAFTEVGGFDPAYLIGYCEDVDLCFRFAERGWRVRYEPRSRVRHLGGASSDPATVEELVRRNTRILRGRWPERLSRRPPLAEAHLRRHRIVEARDIEVNDRILVLDDEVPAADGSSGRRRTARLLEVLAAGWPLARTTFLGSLPATPAEAGWLLEAGVEVAAAPQDLETWFRDRLLHTTVAITIGPVAARDFGEVLSRTQPQALRVYVTEEPATGVVATGLRRAEVAAIREADAIWATTPAKLGLAAGLATEAARFLMPEEGWDVQRLAGALAPLGVAPPRPRRSRVALSRSS